MKQEKIVDDNVFNNTITDKPLPSIERLTCFVKNFIKSNDPGDILQCIAAASSIEVFARELRKEIDEKRKANILALGGKID
jgi:hypothetical protein